MKLNPNKAAIDRLKLLEALERKVKYNKITTMFPKEGKFRRELYPKALAFFKAGNSYIQRLLSGGNRTGKTTSGGEEMTLHLTGRYDEYYEGWEGKRFLNPIKAWAVGISNQVVKEVMQEMLLGPLDDIGSGLIPKELILDYTLKSGVSNTVETVKVRHTGGVSELIFKSYEQKRKDFQGPAKDVIWMDEEPADYGIYEECLMRIMDTTGGDNPGTIYMTFTPLLGLSKLVLSFLDQGRFAENGENPSDPSKWAIQVEWNDIPHLSEQQKEILLQSISPHLRDARTKGLPHLGAGVIYPFPEDEILVEPFQIPSYWPRGYGLDVGWSKSKTAAIWVALDPDSQVYYLYSEHYMGEALPAVHASAIKARGKWIPGVIDTGSMSTNVSDGQNIFDQYENEDLNLVMAEKAIEAGIMKIYQLLAAGRIKVFNTLKYWLQEYRTYRREEKHGKVAEHQHDDLMDAWRYLMMACPDLLELEPDPEEYRRYKYFDTERDSITGY